MPRRFSTFEEAWRTFERAGEMESVPEHYPEREAHLLSWHILVDAAAVPDVLRLQDSLERIDGIVPMPADRLHVSVAAVAVVDAPDEDVEARLVAAARRAWAGVRRFEVSLAAVNVFPTAVVVEVQGDGPAELLDRLLAARYWDSLPWPPQNRESFLPHLTVAIATRRRPAGEVRDVVEQWRGATFGEVSVDHVQLCRIPVARSRLLEPWEVVGRVGFAG